MLGTDAVFMNCCYFTPATYVGIIEASLDIVVISALSTHSQPVCSHVACIYGECREISPINEPVTTLADYFRGSPAVICKSGISKAGQSVILAHPGQIDLP